MDQRTQVAAFAIAAVVEINHFRQCFKHTVVHVRRRVFHLAQRGGAKLADVLRVLGDVVKTVIPVGIAVPILADALLVVLPTVRHLEQCIVLEARKVWQSDVMEFLIRGKRAVVALKTASLAIEERHAALLRIVQRLLVAFQKAVKGHLVGIGYDRPLISRDGAVGIIHAGPFTAKYIFECSHVFRDEAQAHFHHGRIAVACDTAFRRRRRLGFETGHAAFPKQLVVVSGVENGLRIAPMFCARVAAGNLAALAPTQARQMTGNTGH